MMWIVFCWIVFDFCIVVVMGGDEYSQYEVGGYEGEDLVVEVNELVVIIIKVVEDQLG